MKLKKFIPCLATVLLAASAAYSQTTIAKWTFETLTISAGSSYTNWSNGRSITNVLPEIGSGNLSGYHFGFNPTAAGSFATVTGNGSTKALTYSGWTNNPGDYYQFAVSTIGFTNIGFSFDALGSGTGPRDFAVQYSTDGVNFTQFSTYQVLSALSWTASTVQPATSYTNDLSSITSLANASTVYIRLVDLDNTSISGGTVGSGGTSRIDNVNVFGTVPGAPNIITQPLSANIFKGDSITLSVIAGGTAPLAYQWYYTNSGVVTPLVDGPTTYGVITNSATNASVTLTYVATTQAGGYFVVVTNSIGSITSSVASLTVGIRTPIPTTIYKIRTNQTASWFPADTTNLYTVTGTVYTLFNMTSAASREFYIEDATGEGIPVFVGGGTFLPNQGDSVTVTGPIGQFDGLLEFNMSAGNPTHIITDNGSGNPLPTPKYFDLNNLTNIAFVETNIEGSLVVVSNVFMQQPEVAGFVSGSDVIMTNANGVKLNLFVNAGASDVIASTVPRFASSIVGLFGQYTTASPATNAYEVDILQYAGLVAGTPLTANPDSYSMVSNTTSLFSVLTNDTVVSPLLEGALTVSAVSTTNGVAAVDGTGTNITFTPDANFVGTLTLGYTAADADGFTSDGVVTVTVTSAPTAPPILTSQTIPGNLVLSWVNPALYLQSATNVAGPYTYILNATSPFTNNTVTLPMQFFRLTTQAPAQPAD